MIGSRLPNPIRIRSNRSRGLDSFIFVAGFIYQRYLRFPGHNTQFLAADITDDIRRRLVFRKWSRLLLHLRRIGLDDLLDLAVNPVKPVRRHQVVYSLVRAFEIIVFNVLADLALSLLERRQGNFRQTLLVEVAPERLDLAAGLRMIRPAADMPDA